MGFRDRIAQFNEAAKRAALEDQARKKDKPSRAWEGTKRTGRGGLWVALPPVGLWRSVRHGKKQHEKRLAKEIAKELREDRR